MSYMTQIGLLYWETSMRIYCLIKRVNLSMRVLCKWGFNSMLPVPLLQGFIRPVAHVGSGDPVRVLCLYTTINLDEVCSIYC